MIANSHPYNLAASQQQEQIMQQQQQQQNMFAPERRSMHAPPPPPPPPMSQAVTTTSQQNALYGASFTAMTQHQAAFGDALVFGDQQAAVPQPRLSSNQQQQQQQRRTDNTDMTLYSPSSSTSLLYHIYDQINVPNEQQQQQQYHQAERPKSNATTTILNPANLFGQPQHNAHLHNATLASMQLQQFGNNEQQHPQQQQCYSTGQYHLQAPQVSQPIFAQQICAPQQQQQQQQQHFLTQARRPLSSSGASSMSGHSTAIAYGRQLRDSSATSSSHHATTSSKSHANLVHSMHASTLSHLGILSHHAGAHVVGGGQSTSSPSSQHLAARLHSAASARKALHFEPTKWRRTGERVRAYLYEYQTIVKCSLFMILLAFSLMSIIKFTLMPSSSSSSAMMTPSQVSSQSAYNLRQHEQHTLLQQLRASQQQQQSVSNSQGSIQSSNNQLGYAPFFASQPTAINQMEQQQQPPMPLNANEPTTFVDTNKQNSGQQQQDVLKSKLLIGEFVITSQNYSHSAAQNSLLAERIVKLMEQVFLATDVRALYARMQVTKIRPHKAQPQSGGGGGVVVDCNIVLSESIAYAAQQFGLALYQSLSRTNERLANQPDYVIDKNSIRFNTVPDKDLNAGVVPTALIAPSLRKDLEMQPTERVTLAPSDGRPMDSTESFADQANAVVWSEWSQWSSCVDKNGMCDPTRLHSRLRKCVAQHTGDKVDASQCKARFNLQDQELEVEDCSRSCAQQAQQHLPLISGGGGSGSPTQQDGAEHMSDAPMSLPGALEPPALLHAYLSGGSQSQPLVEASQAPVIVAPTTAASVAAQPQQQQQSQSQTANNIAAVSSPPPPSVGLSTQANAAVQPNDLASVATMIAAPVAVAFCAKIKDPRDTTGCGGWCKDQGQLCQAAGSNAYKCVHDSECLANEWRCHNSQCIPYSKRCDGHYNCYDNSDEHDCPNLQQST